MAAERKAYRTALIGTGQSVENHLRALQQLSERVELVAAVDLDEARLRAVCEQYGIPAYYSSSSAMLADLQPDLVQIITPPASHLPLIRECLAAGAWVLCEKPLCLSLAEFDQIMQAEAASQGYVSTVFQWRFGSAAAHLRGLIQQGALGRPLLAICNTLWYRSQAYYALPWRSQWAAGAGGPTSTLGIHLMDLMLWLLGDWAEVQALMATLDHSIEVEDVSLAMLRFESGALASIANSALSPRQESYLRLDFQKATVEVSALYHYENEHWRYSIAEGAAYADELATWQQPAQNLPGDHSSQLAALLDAMDAQQPPPLHGAEARRPIELISALYKAAHTGQPVQRGSIGPQDPFYHALNGRPGGGGQP